MVSHVFSSTLFANFKVGVSMKFSQVFRWNSTLAMETIDVLTYDEFQVVLFSKLNHTHMSLGWVSLLDGCPKSCLIGWAL